MKKVLIELLILLGIGGILWAAFAIFIKMPERPTLISIENEQSIGERMLTVFYNLMDLLRKTIYILILYSL
ncbi:MAG: hypothetical protein F9K37_11310 [Bacteroidales bacterium]|nr:MAG: hypothetical protein F9K37_11310 [Bacteroidales bacterium]